MFSSNMTALLLLIGGLCSMSLLCLGAATASLTQFEEYAARYPNTGPVPEPECSDHLWEGDILHDPRPDYDTPVVSPVNAIVDRSLLWPDATIYYQIMDPSYTPEEIANITYGIYDLVEQTKVDGEYCIQIRPRNDEVDYVYISDNGGCSSELGSIGGAQAMSLARRCIQAHGTIMHEFLHAFGFYHEQSRGDRDEYVIINWNNIEPDKQYNFEKMEENVTIDHLGTSYDYGSVMHYNAYHWAIDPEVPTIIPLDPEAEIGQRTHLSELDIERVQILYGCIQLEQSKYFRHLAGTAIFVD